MSGQISKKGDLLSLVERSGFEKFCSTLINGLAYGMGYAVGFLRYRVFKTLSLFGVLASMSRGLEAATPRDLKNAP